MGGPATTASSDDATAAALVGTVAAPGDAVLRLPQAAGGPAPVVRISSVGLRPEGGAVVAAKCGVVRRTRGGQLWLEGRQKRYACVVWMLLLVFW
jgi:hypothetical protein